MQETRVGSLRWEDPLEKWITTHSSIPAWRISRTEEPGSLQSMGSQRVRQDWGTSTFIFLSHCFLKNFLSSDAQYGELRTTILKSKFPGGFSVKESLPVGLGEISESSISLPSVQSVSLLTVLFTKLLLLLLEASTGSTSGEANAWMRSSASSSSSELKGGVLNKPKSKQGALFPCFRIYRPYAP